MSDRGHRYRTTLIWEGNRGRGTSGYDVYGREYRVAVSGKPDLRGSAHPAFRGDPALHNPEDLFVAALSACHMLTYLALAARSRVCVVAYEDAAEGRMREHDGGGGAFTEVVLRPLVTVSRQEDVQRARELHERAHALCFIAASCRAPVRHEVRVRALDREPA